ncbi:MAG: Fic family protein [Leptospira sp.]|nr:Fic family protein [Leptospira sp.]
MEQEVKNVLDALNLLRDEMISGRPAFVLSSDRIKQFHKLIGKELGDHLEAIPGQFRTHEVTVGKNYRAPSFRYVDNLMDRFCEWVRDEFHFEKGQSFSTAIIQAIVCHVYIAWIHPFGDGNGRTARLVEFFLLLRAGVPDIASHILSNFYNETRNDYYKFLGETSRNGGDITPFIKYALTGFKDGLKQVLEKINENQLYTSWRNYVNEVFDNDPSPSTKKVKKRQMSLILSMELSTSYTEATLLRVNSAVEIEFMNQSKRTINRDLGHLIELGLLINENDTFSANTKVLHGSMAKSRTNSKNQSILD